MKKALFILLTVMACETTDFITESETVYQVPENLQRHVDLFIEEGGQRGQIIEIKNLIIEMTNLLPETACGRCAEEQGQRIIYLNSESRVCWNTPEQFEELIFHELGHCVLNRGHDDSLLPNDAQKSLMASQSIGLYSSCQYDVSLNNDCDQTYRRTYYIDELFDPATSAPYWAFFE